MEKYLIFRIDFPFVTAVTDRINGEQAALLLHAVGIEVAEEGKGIPALSGLLTFFKIQDPCPDLFCFIHIVCHIKQGKS